ncbi:MAG: family 16 glycosylhydrolase [Bacteroidota bacterium]
MRASLFILISFFIASSSFAQTVTDDFEGNGNITTWFGDNCDINTAFANPFQQGLNTSSTVLKYEDTGALYANARFQIPGRFNLTQNASFSIKIYVPSSSVTGSQPNQVSLKLQDGDLTEPWSTQSEVVKPIVLDQWQEVIFDFTLDEFQNLDPSSQNPVVRDDFNRVLIQVNGENNMDQVTAYIDDVYFKDTIQNSMVFNRLVWADEFDGSGSINTSKWHHQTRLPNGTSWYNNEVQHYTNRVKNSFVDTGYLHIMAIKEQFTDQGQTKSYTSARLNSKFAFTYGRVEARAKLPFGSGTWPAIWMLGKNIIEPGAYWTDMHGTVGWPACGEIDIMEHWGDNQNFVQSAIHTPSSHGATINHRGLKDSDVSDEFHIYGMEWAEESIKFSFDGATFYTYAPEVKDASTWPFFEDQYLILNVAMAGNIDPSFSSSPMVIDYIRVYQEGEDPPTSFSEETLTPTLTVFPNPIVDYMNVYVPEETLGSTVHVYSPFGQKVSSISLDKKEVKMDWTEYAPGTYFLVLESGDKQFTYQVLKN